MFCGVMGERGGVHCIKKRKKTDRQYQALDQVFQFITEALLGGFQDTRYLGKNLTGNAKFRGKINGGTHV